MLFNVVISVAHALYFLCVFVRNFDAEFLFKTHHQLDRIQRVGAQVIYEARIWSDFIFINAKLINDDLFDFILDLLIGLAVFAPLSIMSEKLKKSGPSVAPQAVEPLLLADRLTVLNSLQAILGRPLGSPDPQHSGSALRPRSVAPSLKAPCPARLQ